MSTTTPQLQMRYSDDGGYTWSNPRYVSIGGVGAYNQLARFYRLGQGRNRVFKITYKENTPFAIFGASLDATSPPGVS